MINTVVCPKCNAAVGAPCTFKVKDGHQTNKHSHIERLRIALLVDVTDSDTIDIHELDFALRMHELITFLREDHMVADYEKRLTRS